jgi:hypothetical protein
VYVIASIRSNRGDSELSIRFDSAYTVESDRGFHSTITVAEEYWDGDHDLPVKIDLDGFWLSREQLTEMSHYLTDWCNRPLEQLAASHLQRDFELCRLPGQSAMLSFGPRADTIDERKPVLTIALKLGRLTTGIHFVTDQSCIAIFANELAKLISGHAD